MSQLEKETKTRVHIRWMIRRDMAEVREIEDLCFAHPWMEERIIQHLRQRNCIGMVAEVGEQIVGVMIYELFKKRLNVLRFAVHPKFHRQSVGTQMMEKLQGKLSPLRRTHITLDVTERNMTALLFFKAMRFEAVGMLRGACEDTGDDLIEMQFYHS